MADNADTGALCRRDIDMSIRVAVGALAVEAVCPLDFPDFAHESSLALIHEFNQIAASLAEAASLSFKSLAASLVAEFCTGSEHLSTRSQLASRIAPLEQHFHSLRRSLLLHFLPGWIGELGCDKCTSGDAGGGSCGNSSGSSSSASSGASADDAMCFQREGLLAPERRSGRLSALGTRLRKSKQSDSDESDLSDTGVRNDEVSDREQEEEEQWELEEPERKPSRSRRSSKRRKRTGGYEESGGARNSLPKAATHTLKQWLFSHFEKPYPTDDEKLQLSAQTGLSVLQINYYFINARVRIWKPMLANLSNSASKKGAGNAKSK